MLSEIQNVKAGTATARHALSIRARLMILAIIAVVPILLERIHNEQFDRRERVEAAYSQALGIARQAAAIQNDVIVTTRAFLHALAGTRAISIPSDQSCDDLLKNIAAPERWIKALSVANLGGQIVCSSNPEALGLDISKRAHFIDAMKSGAFVLSDYFTGTREKSPLIVAALPQHDASGAIEFVVLATLDPHWLGQITKAITTRSGAIMLLIDGTGNLIAREPDPARWIGRRLGDHPFIKEVLERPEGVVTDASFDGTRRIFAYSTLPGTKAHVAIGFDESEVLARANSAMWIAFAELAAVTCLVLLSIWFGANRLLVRPIRVLAETASRIGRGEDKAHAAGHSWAAEFMPLAAALDEMTKKLEAREQELRDTNTQLRELAQIDALTGLPNRRTFNEQLAAEWKLANELRQPIAVLMVDVDHFKRFNDHYGHVQGDTCLRKVAGVLMSGTRVRTDTLGSLIENKLPPSLHQFATRTRQPDFAARYGGEEFAILLRGANLKTAMDAGERLRKGVEDLLMANAGASWGFVSVSIGAASVLPAADASPQDLTETADASLYEAKRRGRNRVIGPIDMALSRAS